MNASRPLRASLVRAAAAALVLAASLGPAGAALAHDDAPAPPPADYRWAVYTACTVVFALLAVYLVAAHRKAVAAAEDLASLERRLDDLEREGRAEA